MHKDSKPSLKKIGAGFGSSFSVKQFQDPAPKENPPFWHFHPEIELVYVKGGRGRRHFGTHLSYYHAGDLVLIGSMLPHTGFTDRLTENESETIVQFTSDCFGPGFFQIEEMKEVQQLLERAKSGIAFHGEAKKQIGARVEKLLALPNFARMIELLCILQEMASTEEYEILHADGAAFEVEQSDNDRINLIYQHVQQNFRRAIPLAEISAIASMTVPSFCRYFKRISGKNFTRFVNEVRVGHACSLLTEHNLSISNIAMESGYNNFSHFTRIFKDITGSSPSAYRKQFTQVINIKDANKQA